MIGTKELLKLVKEISLVENLDKRELENPEGSGFDIRVDEIYRLKEGEMGFLGVSERHTPETILLAKNGRDNHYILKPGEYVLVKTIESVNLPNDIGSLIDARSTLQRCGVDLLNAKISPGYSGELTLGMKNCGNNDFKIELGARMAHLSFFRTSDNVSAYRGQWQGGRVSTEGEKETQV